MSPSLTRENRELASELKFLVSPDIAQEIRHWSRQHLRPDPHGNGASSDEYKITSLYFDTAGFDVFHQRGSYGRSKYRIRRYGQEDVLFLERKLKTGRVVSKRRSPIPSAQLGRLPRFDSTWPGAWFQGRLQLRRLHPVCQIGYSRTARFALTDSTPVRLTLDEEIHALPACALKFEEGAEGTRIASESVVVEMKFRGEIPLLLKEAVERFALSPRKMSKYRLAASELGLVPANIVSFPGETPKVCLTSS